METATEPRPVPKAAGHWLLGDMRELIRDTLGYVRTRRSQLGDLFEARTWPHKLMFSADPEVARHLLVDNHRNYHKSFDYEILKLVLGDGLIGSDGEFWRKQRRLAQPAFHKKRIEGMFATMLDEGQRLIERWDSFKASGKPFDLQLEMTEVTIRIVSRTLFSSSVGTSIQVINESINQLNNYITDRINNPLLPPPWVPTRRNLRFRRQLRILDDIIYKIIADRRRLQGEQDDLLSMLMNARDEETGQGMTDLQLRDEILTLFLAGHETSATSLTWAFILLSQHPSAMERVRAEVSEALKGELPSLEALGRMPYLRRVIEESMRLYPPAWIVGRKAQQEDAILGYRIPKGHNIIVCIYLIHRHPALWDNPDAFDPDRHLPERMTERHKYAYFPFGGGPRMCIGNGFAMMEMQLLLALLLQRYAPKAGRDNWELDPLVTLRPKGPVPFSI